MAACVGRQELKYPPSADGGITVPRNPKFLAKPKVQPEVLREAKALGHRSNGARTAKSSGQ
jgi:hypothetical protein